MTARVVLSGCSGGGKSTLIEELARRGFETFPEPGRIVVREELAAGGTALPWVDMAAFAARALALAVAFHTRARGVVAFYDRSAIDALDWFDRTGTPVPPDLAPARRLRYHPKVVLAPPWPELFAADRERRHDLASAVAEYEALREAYPRQGYAVVAPPLCPVGPRADWLLNELELARA